jgi:hypothetical protein
MSDHDHDANGQSLEQEVDRTVAVTPEDAQGALDFWHHFKIPIPAAMQTAFDKFMKDPTFENQQEMKLRVTDAIATTDHEAFKDEVFRKIVEECNGVAYEMSFEDELEKTLEAAEKNEQTNKS